MTGNGKQDKPNLMENKTELRQQNVFPEEFYLHSSAIRFPYLVMSFLHSTIAMVFNQLSRDFISIALNTNSSESMMLPVQIQDKNKDDSKIKPDLNCAFICNNQESMNHQFEQDSNTESESSLDLRPPQLFLPGVVPLNNNFMSSQFHGPQLSTIYRKVVKSNRDNHQCPFSGCNKQFNNQHALTNHFRIHTGEKPYKCKFPGCGQAFARQSNLLTHRMIHIDRKMRPKFVCVYPGCVKNFLKKTNLIDHMNSHLGKRPYTCDYPKCGKSFRCRSNLSGHRRVHTRKTTMAVVNNAREPSRSEQRINAILRQAKEDGHFN